MIPALSPSTFRLFPSILTIRSGFPRFHDCSPGAWRTDRQVRTRR